MSNYIQGVSVFHVFRVLYMLIPSYDASYTQARLWNSM